MHFHESIAERSIHLRRFTRKLLHPVRIVLEEVDTLPHLAPPKSNTHRTPGVDVTTFAMIRSSSKSLVVRALPKAGSVMEVEIADGAQNRQGCAVSREWKERRGAPTAAMMSLAG
jgi:hypothetical protein